MRRVRIRDAFLAITAVTDGLLGVLLIWGPDVMWSSGSYTVMFETVPHTIWGVLFLVSAALSTLGAVRRRRWRRLAFGHAIGLAALWAGFMIWVAIDPAHTLNSGGAPIVWTQRAAMLLAASDVVGGVGANGGRRSR